MTTAAEKASTGGGTNGSARPEKTLSERADELEEQMLKQLDKVPSKSPIYTSGEIDPRVGNVRPPLQPGQKAAVLCSDTMSDVKKRRNPDGGAMECSFCSGPFSGPHRTRKRAKLMISWVSCLAEVRVEDVIPIIRYVWQHT